MKNFRPAVADHISRHRFFYIILPVILFLSWVVLIGVNHVQGRASTDDIGGVVGYFYVGIACALASGFAVAVKSRWENQRPWLLRESTPWNDTARMAINAAFTVALIWLFLHFIAPVASSAP